MGIEQLIWAFLILMFLIVSALKNLQKQKKRQEAKAKPIPTREAPRKKPKSDKTLQDFLEDLMGIERPKKRPPIRYEPEEPAPTIVLEQPKEEPILEEEPSEGTKGILVHLEGLKTPQSSFEVTKTLEHPVLLPKKDLKRMVILSEIIGPPIAKRKTHRLF